MSIAVPTGPGSTARARATLRHLGEMALAMLAGMVVLAPLWPLHPARPEWQALVMATDMTVGMTAWMVVRRHPWRGVVTMAAAMYLSFAAVLPAYWLGWIGGRAVLPLGHGAMVLAMVAVVLGEGGLGGRATDRRGSALEGRGSEPRPVSGLRVAGVLAVVGVAVQVPLGYLHPHHAQPNDSVAAFGEYARSHDWVLVHLGQFAGALLVAVGLAVFAREQGRRPGLPGGVAAVAAVSAVVSAAVFAVQMAVDGVALKETVDAWVAARGASRPEAFAVADAVRSVEKGLDALFQICTGTAVLALGLSLVLARRWPWLGLLGTVAGVALLVDGAITAVTGFSPLAGDVALVPTVLLPAFVVGLTVRSGKLTDRPAAARGCSKEA